MRLIVNCYLLKDKGRLYINHCYCCFYCYLLYSLLNLTAIITSLLKVHSFVMIASLIRVSLSLYAD